MRIPAPFTASSRYVRFLTIGLVSLAAAGCSSDTSRFNESANGSNQSRPSSEITGSAGQRPDQPVAQIESRPLDQPAYTNGGTPVYGPSVYGQNNSQYQPNYSQPQPSYQAQPSYQSQYSNAPRSVPAAPAPQYSPVRGDTTGSIGTRPVQAGPITVVLKRGETLHTISDRYKVSVAAILKENNFADASRVKPGTKIMIPAHGVRQASASASIDRASVVHTVAPGETLISIARRYAVSSRQIVHENKINELAPLKIGQKLAIPGATIATTPVQQRYAEAPSQPHQQIAQTNDAPVESVARVKPITSQADAEAQPKLAGGAPSFRWPVKGRVISNFGGKPNGQQNDGINISVPESTAVKASEDGVVAYAGNELKGYGNLVLIRHAGGWVTAYAHNSEVLVHKGETVKRGQVISKAGQTGGVASPQLHFEIRQGSTPVDPTQHLSSL